MEVGDLSCQYFKSTSENFTLRKRDVLYIDPETHVTRLKRVYVQRNTLHMVNSVRVVSYHGE